MIEAAVTSRILTLAFTDLADSTALKRQRRDQAVGELIARHQAYVRRLAAESGGHVIDCADRSSVTILKSCRRAMSPGARLKLVEMVMPG